jgi:hypothetical protein
MFTNCRSTARRPVQHLFGKVKLLGELRLGYSNAAGEFARREPDRNGQPGHISKEDCRPARMRGFLYANRRCGS